MTPGSRRIAALTATVVILCLTALGGTVAAAQVSTLVKDICTNVTASSEPTGLTTLGDRVVFFAQDHLGEKLWTTDGTTAGTVALLAIFNYSPQVLGVVNGRLLFLFTDLASNDELWWTDGTVAGTSKIAELPSQPDGLAAATATARAAYLIRPGSTGWGLWKVEGSSLQMVATVAPATTYSGSFFLVAVGESVLFPGDDGIHGLELWHSDGTPAGTGMVADLWQGSRGSEPKASAAGVIGSRLFFVAATELGCQLWASDGTGVGTHLVKAFAGATDSYNAPSGLTALGDVLLLQADDGGAAAGLWRSDGTAAGTTLVTNDVSMGRSLGVIGNTLIFSGSDAAHGSELWRTDGTAAGTQRIADLNPGPQGITLEPTSIAAGGKVFLSLASNASNDVEPWVTDGTAAGTFRLSDLNQGEGGSDPLFGAALGSTVLFSATDYFHGRELWGTQGAPGSTRLVRDLNLHNNSSAPFGLTDLNGVVLFFTADCGSGSALWRSDGSEGGTLRLHGFKDMPVLGAEREYLVRGDTRVFFVADDGVYGSQLWTSDGTSEGRRPFLDLPPAMRLRDPLHPLWWNGALYVVATDATGKLGLWRSDGTPQGTWLVKEMPGNVVAPYPDWMVGTKRQLFFLLFSSTSGQGYDWWASDGTATGTHLVKASGGGFFLDAGAVSPRVLGERVYFVAYDDVHFHELWRTDGTPEGTVMVKDVFPNDDTLRDASFSLGVAHGKLVFVANDGVHGWEPWASDGTADGTRMIADLAPGPESPDLSSFVGFIEGPGDTFYFAADTSGHGQGLWVSDFTQAGTHIVANLLEPPLTMGLLDGHALGPWFFFSFTPVNWNAPGYVYPTYLFVTRGTSATTSEVKGGWPPDLRRTWSRLGVSNRCLFFCGGDYLHGQELWKVCPPLEPVPRRHLDPAR